MGSGGGGRNPPSFPLFFVLDTVALLSVVGVTVSAWRGGPQPSSGHGTVMSLSYLGLLDKVLLSSVGSIITPCNLCEVLPTVTVQCDSPSKPSPTAAHVRV